VIDLSRIFNVNLSPREVDIGNIICEGVTCNKDIAARLGLTVGTIKVYKTRLWGRLGLKEGSELEHVLLVIGRRDYMREQATKINGWLRKFENNLPTEARKEMEAIMAEMVAELYVPKGWSQAA
jgi:DNA-binding CsgD family transcriptional regulator